MKIIGSKEELRRMRMLLVGSRACPFGVSIDCSPEDCEKCIDVNIEWEEKDD